MRKRNSVKQLNKVTSHRNAMIRNMATSLFEHERIVTTRAKSKVLRSYAEKLITRAKDNLKEGVKPESALHNKREVMKKLYSQDVVAKLFNDIAPRFKDRNGGYTRIIHLPDRKSDSSQMSIIELVDRKEKPKKDRPSRKSAPRKSIVQEKNKASEEMAVESKKGEDRNQDKEKWFNKIMKKKKGE